MERSLTAGIIIIGNEILSGKVRDDNSFFLASELRALGVHLKRILTIPDDVEIIGKEVVGFSKTYDYVFTSGGVGPTHDDVTMAGIAKGFSVKLVENQDIIKVLRTRFNESINSAVLKMANVPEGTEVIISEGNIENAFYVLALGSVDVKKDNVLIDTLTVGECFGEMSLLNNKAHCASVVAKSFILLMKLPAAALELLSVKVCVFR